MILNVQIGYKSALVKVVEIEICVDILWRIVKSNSDRNFCLPNIGNDFFVPPVTDSMKK